MSHKSYVVIILGLGIGLLIIGAGPFGYSDEDLRMLASRIFNTALWWIACELYERFWLTKRFKVSELIAGQTEEPMKSNFIHKVNEDNYALQQQIHLGSVRLAIAVYNGCKWIGAAFVFGCSGGS